MKQDIAVIVDPITGLRDIAIGTDGDFESVDDFSTSIDLSILTDRRAEASEVPEASSRRGWIGDLTPNIEGFKVGSKVWLFEQSRRVPDTINGIRDAVQEGLFWLVEEGKVDRLQVEAVATGRSGVQITVVFFIENDVTKRYFNLWNLTEERIL